MLKQILCAQALLFLGQTHAQAWNQWANADTVYVTVTNFHTTCPCDGSSTSGTVTIGPISTTTISTSMSTSNTNTIGPISTGTTSTTSVSSSVGPISTGTTSSTTTVSSTSTTVTTITTGSTSTTSASTTTTTTATSTGPNFFLRASGSTLVPNTAGLNLVPDATFDDGVLVFNTTGNQKRDLYAPLVERQSAVAQSSTFNLDSQGALSDVATGYVLAATADSTDDQARMVSRSCLGNGYIACVCTLTATNLSCLCGAGASIFYVDVSGNLFIAVLRAPSPGQYDRVGITYVAA